MNKKCTHYDYSKNQRCSNPRATDGSFGFPYDHYCREHAQKALTEAKQAARSFERDNERQAVLEDMELEIIKRRAAAKTNSQSQISPRFKLFQYLQTLGCDPTKFNF
jgi:hypothetical protein